MHLGIPECHKPFLGHCDLDLWPRFQELLCPEHISYIIWCRNPKFGVVILCIPFWVILTLTLTSGLISSFFLLYYSYLSSNVSYTRPIPLGAFVTCLWHFLFTSEKKLKNIMHVLVKMYVMRWLFCGTKFMFDLAPKIVSEYDQEVPQSQTADNPVAPRGRSAQPSRDTRKTNSAKQPALSSPSRWLQY